MTQTLWPWLALAGLGVYHGINPGMGWLFAVSRGLQERSRRAVLSSLVPIALGHELSIVVVVIVVAVTQSLLPPHTVRLMAALLLVAFGVYTLARPRSHPRGFGMRVGVFGLALWSFLMSSAHGAGLMLAPVLLGLPVASQFTDLRQLGATAALAATVHVTAMATTMGLVAVVVYEKLGLGLLRRSWFNLDLAWSVVLLTTGAVTLFTA
ncbi:MAG: hypothetical protein M3075_13910 [Candidatus Dormibacteraeota bacterium]|nr:hypothetical protein [Candidatus Dormibacteraeota bacterium]